MLLLKHRSDIRKLDNHLTSDCTLFEVKNV